MTIHNALPQTLRQTSADRALSGNSGAGTPERADGGKPFDSYLAADSSPASRTNAPRTNASGAGGSEKVPENRSENAAQSGSGTGTGNEAGHETPRDTAALPGTTSPSGRADIPPSRDKKAPPAVTAAPVENPFPIEPGDDLFGTPPATADAGTSPAPRAASDPDNETPGTNNPEDLKAGNVNPDDFGQPAPQESVDPGSSEQGFSGQDPAQESGAGRAAQTAAHEESDIKDHSDMGRDQEALPPPFPSPGEQTALNAPFPDGAAPNRTSAVPPSAKRPVSPGDTKPTPAKASDAPGTAPTQMTTATAATEETAASTTPAPAPTSLAALPATADPKSPSLPSRPDSQGIPGLTATAQNAPGQALPTTPAAGTAGEEGHMADRGDRQDAQNQDRQDRNASKPSGTPDKGADAGGRSAPSSPAQAGRLSGAEFRTMMLQNQMAGSPPGVLFGEPGLTDAPPLGNGLSGTLTGSGTTPGQQGLAAPGSGINGLANGLTSVSGARPAQTTPSAGMADQIVGALTRHQGAGRSTFRIQLHPAELGQVEVRMDFATDGKLHTTLTVDNDRSLMLLQRDQGALEKMLQNAGFDTSQGNLNFSLKQQNHTAREQFAEQPSGGGEDGSTPSETGTGPQGTAGAATPEQLLMTAARGGVDISI